MKILRKILWITLLFFLAGVLFAVGYYYAVTKDARLPPEKLLLNEKSVVLYDSRGDIVRGAFSPALKQTVKINELPKHTKQAFIDAEDKRFYQHGGYDFKGIARAVVKNVQAGNFKQGASTISQQLIKNTHLSQEKTLKRKLREWKLTRQLEKKYTKNEILEKYVNSIYFGHSCFGIKSAAEFYFDKSPQELSLSDSAILAGLVRSPNNYSPFRNPEKCAARKRQVLNAMLKNGSIDEQAKQAALNEPLPKPIQRKNSGGYVQFVFDELTTLAEARGFTVGGNVRIRTYLDQALQERLETLALPECDVSILALDSQKQGYKAALSTVGNIRRLPGSLIKPLLVYAPALEENALSPATPILDEKINYSGYAPENYDGKCHGYVSARECVEKSLNIPAVKTLETIGIKRGVAYLQKMNLPVEKGDESLALALGGMKKGYTLQELTNAYHTLANGGNYQECGFISSVEINGVQVYNRTLSDRKVFSEESAYLMTDMLISTAKNGTAKKLRSLPFEVAAKTGTVGTSKGNTDAYAVAYTPLDCVSVWLGNADNSRIEHTGGGVPCNLLLQIHEYLYGAYQSAHIRMRSFSKPTEVVRVALDKSSYYDTHTLCLADENAPAQYCVNELFKKSAIPLNKSDSFSKPSIFSPSIRIENGDVIITLDERSPRYYQYKIDRYDYATHTTLYQGEYQESFTDKQISKSQKYVYTITPIYQGKEGTSVTLPEISIARGDAVEDYQILHKDWWDY